MPDLASICRAIDFVEGNLQQPITVAAMAASAGYSLYYFCRVFNQVTHHTPYDYLIRRRLSESARVLLGTEKKIIDIALDYQFSGPETFSRAFKRMFDTQPSQMRKVGHVEGHRLMQRLTLAHLQHIQDRMTTRPELVERGPMRLHGLMTLVRDGQADRERLWRLVDRELGRIEADVQPQAYYGVASFPLGWESDGFPYLAAFQSEGSASEATNLVHKALPGTSLSRFVHCGDWKDLSLSLDYIYSTWLPKTGTRPWQLWIIEDYGPELPTAGTFESGLGIGIPVLQEQQRRS
jgi:AraC family transcriptional regulator